MDLFTTFTHPVTAAAGAHQDLFVALTHPVTAAAGALQSNDGRFAMLTSSFFSVVQPV